VSSSCGSLKTCGHYVRSEPRNRFWRRVGHIREGIIAEPQAAETRARDGVADALLARRFIDHRMEAHAAVIALVVGTGSCAECPLGG
jgi:hypothetical protein